MSQQLVKKGTNGRYDKVMPRSWIEAIKDKYTGQSLLEILQGFNCYFLSYTGDVFSTRLQVPRNLRKKGLWITYVDYNDNLYSERYMSSNIDDDSWSNSVNWEFFEGADVTIHNNPDYEDLTVTRIKDTECLKFKDRDTSKGKGYIILRAGKSLTEQMMQENTIYEVRYDFDLNGETLEIPADCVLDFKGGSIKNGILVGRNTRIYNTNGSIFKNLELGGSYNTDGVHVEWFRDSSLTDSEIIANAINNAVSSGIYQVYLAPIQYNIDSPITVKVKVALTGVYNGTRLNATNENVMLTWSGLTDFCDISNIYFCGYGGKAIYNESYDYASTFHIHDCQFDAELEQCIRGNFILSTIDKCHFGYYGTPHPNHGHITIKGDTSGPMSNINKITDSRFYRSTANYSCIFEAGIELLISKCNFETNNNKVCAIKFAGANTFEVEHCWFEHCLGDYIALITSNSEGYIYGNYVINFNNNYFYMNNANKEIFYLSGSSYSVEFVNNFASNFTGKYITYDGVSYDNGVKTFYNNNLWPTYNGKLINSFNTPSPTATSKGLLTDIWFKEWDANRPNGWKKRGILTWESYVDNSLPTQFNRGGIHIWSSNETENMMYVTLPIWLVKGKKIRLEAIYKNIKLPEGAAYQLAYNITEETPTSMTVIGDYFLNSTYTRAAASFDVPSTAEYCHVGIKTGGLNIELVLKAFDAFIVYDKITPTIGNEGVCIDNTIKPVKAYKGMWYFDTDKNKPLWYNGSQWVDSTGVAEVSEEE